MTDIYGSLKNFFIKNISGFVNGYVSEFFDFSQIIVTISFITISTLLFETYGILKNNKFIRPSTFITNMGKSVFPILWSITNIIHVSINLIK